MLKVEKKYLNIKGNFRENMIQQKMGKINDAKMNSTYSNNTQISFVSNKICLS